MAGYPPLESLYYYYSYPKDLEKLRKQFGLELTNKVPPDRYPTVSPDLTSEPDKNTAFKPVESRLDIAYSLNTAFHSVKKYPLAVIRKNMTQIYLSNELTIRGAKASGTYDAEKKSIYLLNSFQNRSDLGWARHFLETTIHHELSSLLMHNYQFDDFLWRKAMGKNFLYEKDKDPWYEWKLVRGQMDAPEISEEELLNRGLLAQYAETGVENDFNTYAEVIFSDPTRMKKLVHEYPTIAKKYQVFKEFYLSIDNGFAPIFEKIDGQKPPLETQVSGVDTAITIEH